MTIERAASTSRGSAVETLVLTHSEVAQALSRNECREAVARAFMLLGEGRVPAPRSLAFEVPGGGFHVKAALYDGARFVAKLNGNFPQNPAQRGLPTIQGVLLLADAGDGRPLAIMDSAAVTAIRTAAASAVAADRLARRDAGILAIVGCGRQGFEHAHALFGVRRIREIRLCDVDPSRAAELATRLGAGVDALPSTHGPAPALRVTTSVRESTRGADLVATCTTGTEFVLGVGDVDAGAFVAAVGADNPHKREIHPELMARASVVVDDLAQCAAGGDLHHAVAAGLMRPGDAHAELAAVVAGRHPGRARDVEIIVFDSTGIALEDAAAAELAYQRALTLGLGTRLRLGT